MLGKDVTWFASYELYYDTKYEEWVRQRLIGGFSYPFTDWLTTDLFYGYHVVTVPEKENAGAWGLAIGFWF